MWLEKMCSSTILKGDSFKCCENIMSIRGRWRCCRELVKIDTSRRRMGLGGEKPANRSRAFGIGGIFPGESGDGIRRHPIKVATSKRREGIARGKKIPHNSMFFLLEGSFPLHWGLEGGRQVKANNPWQQPLAATPGINP